MSIIAPPHCCSSYPALLLTADECCLLPAGIVCTVVEAPCWSLPQAYLEQCAHDLGKSYDGCWSLCSLSGDSCLWCGMAMVPTVCILDWHYPGGSVLHRPHELQEGMATSHPSVSCLLSMVSCLFPLSFNQAPCVPSVVSGFGDNTVSPCWVLECWLFG